MAPPRKKGNAPVRQFRISKKFMEELKKEKLSNETWEDYLRRIKER